jgi:hypothetical protein
VCALVNSDGGGGVNDNPNPTNKQQNNSVPSVEKKGRGGKRPGAGAPKGNLNALKTGLYSKQFAVIGRLLASHPTTREALLQIADRLNIKQRNSIEIASLLLAMTFERSREQSGNRLNLPLPSGDWDSIRGAAHQLSGGQYGNLPAEAFQPQNEKNSAGFNRNSYTDPKFQSDPDTKNR